jgi:DNA (cytosine-5)-methyltransferase 1
MRFGSLFAGIGGIDLGLERAGMRCAWQVEIDPFCRSVLARHWPDVPRHEDVRAVDFATLPQVDVLAGGFPCQDISHAGNRGERSGTEGERSGLWSEFARAIRAARPGWVLVENVPAILVRGIGTVLSDLAAIGYDAEWDCLPAATFGAPQRRDRLFLVAYPHRSGWAGSAERHVLSEARIEPPRRRHVDGLDLVEAGPWSALPDVLRVDYGVPGTVDQLRALGNAVVPQVAEWIGRRIVGAAEHTGTRKAA